MKQHLIEKVGSILNLFSFQRPEWGVREAAEALDLPKSTMGDILLSLADQGMLSRTSTGRYRLGWRLFELSQVLLEHTEFCIEARRAMHELVERWGETTHLAVLDGTQVLFVEKLQATPATTIMFSRVSVGSRFSAHGLAVGKVLLAYQAWFSLPTVLEKLELTAYTPTTITTHEQLIQQLEDARRQGYAYDHEEVTQGICCVAAPIFDIDGRVPAAISFCIPAHRFFPQEDHYTEIIVRSAQSISEKLGYRAKGVHAL